MTEHQYKPGDKVRLLNEGAEAILLRRAGAESGRARCDWDVDTLDGDTDDWCEGNFELVEPSDPEPERTLLQKLEAELDGYSVDLAAYSLRIFQEHFDSKRDEIDSAVTRWIEDPKAGDTWLDEVRAIIFSEQQ